MHLFNAAAVVRMATRCHSNPGLGAEIAFGTVSWFLYAGISCFLVLFAGIMSGLTLGLMSLGLVDLEILQRSGTPSEKKQAGIFYFMNLCGYDICSVVIFLGQCISEMGGCMVHGLIVNAENY